MVFSRVKAQRVFPRIHVKYTGSSNERTTPRSPLANKYFSWERVEQRSTPRSSHIISFTRRLSFTRHTIAKVLERMYTVCAVITATCELSGLHCTRLMSRTLMVPRTWKEEVSKRASWSGDTSNTRPAQPPGKILVQPGMGRGIRLATQRIRDL